MRVIFLILMGLSSLSLAEFSKQNGIVYDSITKLEWQDDYSDNGGKIKEAIWQDAINYCENLSLEGGGWRLPNIRELESLVDDSRYEPAIHDIFKLNISAEYWSATSTNLIYHNDKAWTVCFSSGNVDDYTKYYVYYVRCVRDAKN
jgi:hypothetical protein